MEKERAQDRDDDLILAAAAMFHAAAMQQLGKMVNPVSGKVERDLAAARFSIDVVAALGKKTEGRLGREATLQLERMATELRMNFLEEQGKAASADGAGKATSAGDDSAAADADAAGETRDTPPTS